MLSREEILEIINDLEIALEAAEKQIAYGYYVEGINELYRIQIGVEWLKNQYFKECE